MIINKYMVWNYIVRVYQLMVYEYNVIVELITYIR